MIMKIPSGYIDIHSHILPGLDDGPENMAQCVEAARRYRAIGMHCVVATPHWLKFTGWTPSPERVIRSAAEVEAALRQAGAPLLILPGMEIGLTDSLEQDFSSSELLPLGTSGYYLIEFPLMVHHRKPEQLILRLLRSRPTMRIILAHPERCASFLDNAASLREMTARGVLVQVTIDSLLGGFGREVQETAVDFLRRGLVHFLATDSHAAGRRMPPDRSEWITLGEYIGPAAVDAACRENPRRLLTGGTVAPVAAEAGRLDAYFPGSSTRKESKTDNADSGRGLAGRLRSLFRK
jgi:protein-tyrosine phosphatase